MLSKQVKILLQQCRERGFKLRFAESCTAGALSASIASVSGASDVLDRAWVTYSNQAKIEELGVDVSLLETHGAVSEQVAISMAEGGAATDTFCLAITGIAGPDGGSVEKPVGTVWMAICRPDGSSLSQHFLFHGSRHEIQAQAVESAIALLYKAILNENTTCLKGS